MSTIFSVGNIKEDKLITVLLPATGWAIINGHYEQTITDEFFVDNASFSYICTPNTQCFDNYCAAGVRCQDIMQNGVAIFRCNSVPSSDLLVNLLRICVA